MDLLDIRLTYKTKDNQQRDSLAIDSQTQTDWLKLDIITSNMA